FYKQTLFSLLVLLHQFVRIRLANKRERTMITTSHMLMVTFFCALLFSLFPSFRKRWLLALTMTLYVGLVAAITLFPIPIDPNYISIQRSLGENYHPYNNTHLFSSIYRMFTYGDSWRILKEFGGNLLLLAPIGVLFPIVQTRHSIVHITFFSFLASLTIESTQWLISRYAGYVIRVADIDDLLLNVIGAVLAYMLFCGMRQWTLTPRGFNPFVK
ncbi:MAG: VanZ family protein, partial [Bacilli bacterium]